jgi:hypothetical protein
MPCSATPPCSRWQSADITTQQQQEAHDESVQLRSETTYRAEIYNESMYGEPLTFIELHITHFRKLLLDISNLLRDSGSSTLQGRRSMV